MWAFLRRLSATSKPQQSSAIEQLALAQSKALIELCQQQQQTLDRIVAAKYDRPFQAPLVPQPNPTMPDFMMTDQTDTSPLSAVLSVDSDQEFIDRMSVQ